MVGQASSLSIRDDGQDAHPTDNLIIGAAGDWFAALAMTIFCHMYHKGLRGEKSRHRR